jgi:hypothetical protein
VKSKQEAMIEIDGKQVARSKVCFKLRKQTVDGKEIECATDAFYERDKTGALHLLYNVKPGKAARKAAKRERVKERNKGVIA